MLQYWCLCCDPLSLPANPSTNMSIILCRSDYTLHVYRELHVICNLWHSTFISCSHRPASNCIYSVVLARCDKVLNHVCLMSRHVTPCSCNAHWSHWVVKFFVCLLAEFVICNVFVLHSAVYISAWVCNRCKHFLICLVMCKEGSSSMLLFFLCIVVPISSLSMSNTEGRGGL